MSELRLLCSGGAATGLKHEGEEWSLSGVESAAAGGVVCTAAAELRSFGVPAGSTEGADGGARAAGGSDAGAVPELQAAGGGPEPRPCRGQRAEEAPTQQKTPGGGSDPRGEGHDDEDGILHGSCQSPHGSV